jgi:hypothetical protein
MFAVCLDSDCKVLSRNRAVARSIAGAAAAAHSPASAGLTHHCMLASMHRLLLLLAVHLSFGDVCHYLRSLLLGNYPAAATGDREAEGWAPTARCNQPE